MKKILLLLSIITCSYSIAQNKGKVGINTKDPKATLDVEGHMKIEKDGMAEYVFPSPRPEELSLLFRNKKTGILVSKKGAKSIYKLQYKIYTDEATRNPGRSQAAKDYTSNLYSYNTKIPYNEYYLIQTHSIFKIENPDGTIEVPGLTTIFNEGDDEHFYPLKRVRLAEHLNSDQNLSTWFIYANYPGTKITLQKEGQKAFWEITVLAIDRKYITDVSESYQQ